VSCDSLLRHRFAEMTRRDALDRVLAGLEAARAAGFDPIKVNCVVVAGTNDDEVLDFAELARREGYEIRFIEFMPLDADGTWERAGVLPSAEILRAVDQIHPLVPRNGHGPQPATVFGFADGSPGSVGVIPTVTEPFCESCNRVRLTAEGDLRACLFSLEETDLRAPMRDRAGDPELEGLIRSTVWGKWAGHRINEADFRRPGRSMSMIGG
jgi:GTP 3',8-cyclase